MNEILSPALPRSRPLPSTWRAMLVIPVCLAVSSMVRPVVAQTLEPEPAAAEPGGNAAGEPPELAPGALEAGLGQLFRAGGLTSDNVVRQAIRVSPDLEGRRHNVAAADHDLGRAKAQMLPALSLSARYTRFSPLTPGAIDGVVVALDPTARQLDSSSDALFARALAFPIPPDAYYVSASLSIPLSDYVVRLREMVKGAEHAKAGAEWEARSHRRALVHEARIAYYLWIRALAAALVAEQSLLQARGHLEDAKSRLAAGGATRADALRAESQVPIAQLELVRARNTVELATTRLRVLMHDAESARYAPGEDIFADTPRAPEVVVRDAYDEAVKSRSELRTLEERRLALRSEALATASEQFPRLDALANAQYSNPNPRLIPPEARFIVGWDVGVLLSWAPSSVPGTRARLQAIEARAAELAAERSLFLDTLRVEITQASSAVVEAEFAIDASRQALAAAYESYRVRRGLFRTGRTALLEVTDAQADLTHARFEWIDAHVARRLARSTLQHAMGRDHGP